MQTLVIAAAVIAACLVGLRWALYKSFQVPRLAPDSCPADHGLVGQRVEISGANGKTLRGWFIPSADDACAPAILLMHGWGAEHSSLLPLTPPLHQAGFALLLMDARSHGASDADSFSSMPRFAEDVEAGLNWLRQRPAIDAHRLAVIGHSVGGAAALLAASRQTELGAVVSLAAFDHPERVMRVYLKRLHIPYRPLGWLICRYVERVIGHRFDHIAPIATIGRVRCPVLIGHGADDQMVPSDAARAIHARATATATAQLRILDGTGHEDCPDMIGLGHLLSAFLCAAMPQKPNGGPG